MKIISQHSEVLTRTVTVVELGGSNFTVLDFYNEYGAIVDTDYRDEDGNLPEIEIVALLEEVMATWLNGGDVEESRRDEKNGLYGEHVDDAN